MPANPTLPTLYVKSITVGDNAEPGQITIINGKLVMNSGATSTATDMLIDGVNKKIELGNSLVKLDGANKRIIINDGTNDRILIGYYAGLF